MSQLKENIESPIVSVCVQTYNHQDYIAECLDSIIGQKTDFKIEIIIGEDSSQDDTYQICAEYAEKYPDLIRLVQHSREDVIWVNGNPTGRFNMMSNIAMSKGKYIAILEGDDYWKDEFKLAKQVAFLEKNTDFVACHGWHSILKKENNLWVSSPAPKEGHGYMNAMKGTLEDVLRNELRLKARTIMFRNIIEFPEAFKKIPYGDI